MEEITCPYCNSILEVSNIKDDEIIECPGCGQSFIPTKTAPRIITQENISKKPIKVVLSKHFNKLIEAVQKRKKFNDGDIQSAPRSKFAFMFLGLIGGCIGLHYFYINNFKKGLLFICSIPLCFILATGAKYFADNPLPTQTNSFAYDLNGLNYIKEEIEKCKDYRDFEILDSIYRIRREINARGLSIEFPIEFLEFRDIYSSSEYDKTKNVKFKKFKMQFESVYTSEKIKIEKNIKEKEQKERFNSNMAIFLGVLTVLFGFCVGIIYIVDLLSTDYDGFGKPLQA